MKLITKKEINIIAQAFKEALSQNFDNVTFYIDGFNIELEVGFYDSDIEVGGRINYDEIAIMVQGNMDMREYYKNLVDDLLAQAKEITNLQKELTTLEAFDKIEHTKFLKETEELFKMIYNESDNSSYADSAIRNRVKGKTTTLAYLSMKYDLPLLVDNKILEKIINKEFPEVETILFSDINIKGKDIDMVLADEVKYDSLIKLRDSGIRFFGFFQG